MNFDPCLQYFLNFHNPYKEQMNITLHINGIDHEIETPAHTTLLSALRGLGFHGVKFGDEQGLTGADTILLDGKPVNAGSLLVAQAEGHQIATIEALGEHPEQGWKHTDGLHPLAESLCCDRRHPVRILHPGTDSGCDMPCWTRIHPSEAEVREAISGVLCRCTGYLKPVQAVSESRGRDEGRNLLHWKQYIGTRGIGG